MVICCLGDEKVARVINFRNQWLLKVDRVAWRRRIVQRAVTPVILFLNVASYIEKLLSCIDRLKMVYDVMMDSEGRRSNALIT